jgi:hypothetical protein
MFDTRRARTQRPSGLRYKNKEYIWPMSRQKPGSLPASFSVHPGYATSQWLSPRIAREARGPPANGPSAGPQRHSSLRDLQPLGFRICQPFDSLSTKRYEISISKIYYKITPFYRSKLTTPGNITGDVERNRRMEFARRTIGTCIDLAETKPRSRSRG